MLLKFSCGKFNLKSYITYMEFPYMLKSHSTQCKDMFFSDSVIQLAKNNSIKYPKLTNRNFLPKILAQ